MLLTFASIDARADNVTWIPGNSREIPRTASAARDAPVSDLIFAPRVGAKGAVDFAFSKIDLDGIALRPGMYAAFELEHADPGVEGTLPLPGQGKGPMLWRGLYGLSLSLSAERLAHDWLGKRGAIEIVVTGGHESDHVTGDSFDDAPQPGDIMYGGGSNHIQFDFALRKEILTHVDAWTRIQDRACVQGPILHAPAAEIGARWHALPHFEPLMSAFGEALLVDHNQNRANDGGSVAILAGIGVVGALGELIPFTSLDIGNGKGLLINRREADVVIGVRYAPF
ncbi:MAG: hypothetical protein ACRELY_00470 [Polyangiaceae bacterium]